MGILSRIIERRFEDIAGRRYEEILSEYREFFLTAEEMTLPEVRSILMVFDYYSERPNEKVYEVLSAYPEASINLIYMLDENVARFIEATLGKEEANRFREVERNRGEALLQEVGEKLKGMGFKISLEVISSNKTEDVIPDEKYDLVVVSKKYGMETSDAAPASPLVVRMTRIVEKPIIIY